MVGAHAFGGILKLHLWDLQLDWDGSISASTDAVAIVAILVTGFLAWKEYTKEGH